MSPSTYLQKRLIFYYTKPKLTFVITHLFIRSLTDMSISKTSALKIKNLVLTGRESEKRIKPSKCCTINVCKCPREMLIKINK